MVASCIEGGCGAVTRTEPGNRKPIATNRTVRMHGEAKDVLCIRNGMFVVMGFRPGGQGSGGCEI